MIRSPLLFALSPSRTLARYRRLGRAATETLGHLRRLGGGRRRRRQAPLLYRECAEEGRGKYTTRGDAHVLVTHRPADKVKGEVSVSAGYPYKEGKDAEADIDGKKFKLFTRGENAWAYDAAEDRAMVAAMKAGKQLIVRGTSSRGTATTDTYSLSGFSAALAAIDKACGNG